MTIRIDEGPKRDISEIHAYYTLEQKARHGRHCETWTNFGARPGQALYRTGDERAFIANIEAANPGCFANYLISWSGNE